MRKILLTLCAVLLLAAQFRLVQAEQPLLNDYRVGVDDALEISVLEPEKITTVTTVSPDGAVTFPYIGNVAVKGMSLAEIQENIQKRLAEGYMKYPVVSVTLKESRSRKFFVYGDVTKPGVYQLDENTTILKAISIAGGFSKYGSSSMVKVLRQKDNGAYETTDVDIKAVMEGKANANMVLQPGDTITVSEGKFYVYGDVAKPGAYPLEQNTTVLKAISIAGGFLKNDTSSMVKIVRQKEKDGGNETIEVDMQSVMKNLNNADILLKPGDTITVSEGKFYVYGDVVKPGAYPMENGMSVLKAISVAGGFVKSGLSSEVKILRPKVKDTGYETIEVDIRSVMKGVSEADSLLKPHDTVMVSEGRFYVYGEVNKPGVYSMEGDTSVLKAIAMAGGFTKYGSSSRVKVLRLKETGVYETIKVNIKEIMDGAVESDVAIKSGDTVVIMEGMF